jgi:hypothetical protein
MAVAVMDIPALLRSLTTDRAALPVASSRRGLVQGRRVLLCDERATGRDGLVAHAGIVHQRVRLPCASPRRSSFVGVRVSVAAFT